MGNTISPAVTPRGGIPKETKLAPLLFAVFVNNLSRQWNLRAKYVDDLTIIEVIPRTSKSMLPVITNSVSTFASQHGMRLNGAKCKDMLMDFLKYKPFSISPADIHRWLAYRSSKYPQGSRSLHLVGPILWSLL